MLVCDDPCVWGRPVAGLAEDGEGSLKTLLNSMVTVWVRRVERRVRKRDVDSSAKQAKGRIMMGRSA